MQLKNLQEWFGKALQNRTLEVDATLHIAPSHTLNSQKRLTIYHEQYWWRLLTVLQKNFPTLVRELGVEQFNEEIAIPYLAKMPPNDWALCRLGSTLADWLSPPLSIMASLDWAAELAFWEKEKPKVDFSVLSPEEMVSIPLTLQPYVSLFELEEDFFTYREKKGALKKKHGYYVVYRTEIGLPAWKEIPQAAFRLLRYFQKGCSIEAGCAQIEAGDEVAFWFKEWTTWQFFAHYSSQCSSST